MNKSTLLLLIFIVLLICGASVSAAEGSMDELTEDALTGFVSSLSTVPSGIKTVAVSRIEPDRKGRLNTQQLTDRLNSLLLESGRFSVIDRSSLSKLLEEQKLSMSGVVDTAHMVEVGKLVGVQGFLFGSAQLEDDRLILNLKLVDVKTSAIIYARKFTGEEFSKGKFALGWLYANNSFGTDLDLNNLLSPGLVSYELEGDAASAAGFIVSYKQSLKKNRSFKVGADMSFSMYQDMDGGTKRVDDSAAHVAFHDITVMHISVKSKLYFSGKRFLGMKSDFFTPYLGAAFNYYNFELFFDAENFSGGGLPKEESEISASVTGITPLVGAEFNFTRSVSAYVEFSFDSELAYSNGRKVLVSDVEMESFPFVGSGAHWNLGLKYYFSLF